MTKSVSLNCPSAKKTVDNFVISPYQTNDQVLHSVRLAFNIKHAALYTVDAKPIVDMQSVQDDQRILVAAAPDERMLPDAPVGFVLYDGEEGDDVDPDVEGFGLPWEELSEREKGNHIINLIERKPTTRNKVRITRSYEDVQACAKQLTSQWFDPSATRYVPHYMETIIEDRWLTTYDHFIPEWMRPPKVKIGSFSWDFQVLVHLEFFSSLTIGQARLAAEYLEEAVKMRMEESEDTSPVVTADDVVNAWTIIYERAGIIPAHVTKPKSAKAKGKERRKALKERKKAEAKDKSLGGAA